ncbi:Addiction module toxin RelE [Klebsiella michiganensis]|uniref:Uncharacterized protein n=1 Tax=Klebsiella michiganensis TaxID=1134687 RepID=A0A7H5A2V3_9ENTR|nr:hypothetical protein L373_05443 [Klebsiella michiganensis]CAB1209802.1 hypothetical protein SFB9_0697 [Klebsiella michiganensis]SBL17366.1 Uncharacterised protein [Klebsiella michiganensis]STW26835.1 Uncharacterised protein [Klebsiella michiganensis]
MSPYLKVGRSRGTHNVLRRSGQKKSPDTGKGDTYNRMKPCLIVLIRT